MNCRSTLMGGGAAAVGGSTANPWLIDEPDETKGLSFGEIKQQQQRIIEGNLLIMESGWIRYYFQIKQPNLALTILCVVC